MEKIKKEIIEMIMKIDDVDKLNRIFRYIHNLIFFWFS